MCLQSNSRPESRRGERGWVMLTLLLAMALMAIFAAVALPSITFEIRRDREEEMIHRGTQYSRAIRAYYKKFGRYPTKIEDLESANNLRFLRRRYKDPITGQDFKLLHFGEAKLSLSGGIGGGTIPGANPIGAASGLNGGPGGLNGPGGSNGGPGGFSQPVPLGGNAGFGGNSNSAFGQNQQAGGNPPPASDPSQPGAQSSPDGTAISPAGTTKGTDNNSGDKLAGVTFGGGPIVGVTSNSKKDTIREFNHKKKYNEWQFIYDPANDMGFLIKTPNQPQVPGFGQQGMQSINGQNVNGQPGSSNGLGTSPQGMQNTPNTPPTGGYGTPNPPSNPPPISPQQQ
jgi:type II secretory pathway pseudopilin PulG